jgi:hypothetical protein
MLRLREWFKIPKNVKNVDSFVASSESIYCTASWDLASIEQEGKIVAIRIIKHIVLAEQSSSVCWKIGPNT